MPVYKALILNKEIIVNYEDNEKDKLVEAIKEINSKLDSYDNFNGKISDSKLLTFLAIKLQAELLDLNKQKKNQIILESKFNESKNDKISLNDKIYKLRELNELLKKENDLINQELTKLKSQIEIIIELIKKTYEE